MTTETTAIVTLCDEAYLEKALRTIQDIRSVGEWKGDLVLIAVGFQPNPDICLHYGIQVAYFPRIPTEHLLAQYQTNPLSIPTHDRREYKKLTQWEKLHVFDPYFQRWNRIIFVDAGLRILDSLEHFLCLEWRGKLLAQDDTWNDATKRFRSQVEMTNNPEILQTYTDTFGTKCLHEPFFLNCMWIYDTSLLKMVTKNELLDTMNKFPLWRTNEMGVMNTLFTFKYRLWKPFHLRTQHGKYLLDWSERNRPNTTWRNYCALKYPVTL